MALTRKWIASPNYSARSASVRLIVIHTAEGALDWKSLGQFFSSASAQVSSHVGIDNETPGVIGEYVKRGNSAWCQANANSLSICVELCGFAAWTPGQWEQHPTMLDNCARWIAEEARHYGLPIQKLSAAQAEQGGRGVCGHADLGWAGNDHWDPGGNFPWAKVIAAAKSGGSVYGPAAPPPMPVLRALPPFIADSQEPTMPPDYVINDVANGSRKFAVYASGLVRRMPGPEFQYARDHYDVAVVEMNNRDEGERFYQYDQALRGQVKERE